MLKLIKKLYWTYKRQYIISKKLSEFRFKLENQLYVKTFILDNIKNNFFDNKIPFIQCLSFYSYYKEIEIIITKNILFNNLPNITDKDLILKMYWKEIEQLFIDLQTEKYNYENNIS